MLKHIIKIIWNQRRSNGFIFGELLIVVGVLWIMLDSLLVDIYTYNRPLGFDISNVYRIQIGKLSPDAESFVSDEKRTTSDGEDMLHLLANLEQSQEVEVTCVAAVGCPYSWGSMFNPLIQSTADSTEKARSYRTSFVNPSYFDVLRMKDGEGNPIRQQVERSSDPFVAVLSADLEHDFFDTQSGRGQRVKTDAGSEVSIAVAAVTTPIRYTEFQKSEPRCFIVNMTDERVLQVINGWGATQLDYLVRMKDGFRAEDMEAFLSGISERLQVNNLYISSVDPIARQRGEMLKSRFSNMKKKGVLVGFMLVNVFFGIVGTFWLRTQYRRGELGLRSAVGASRARLKWDMDMEGFSLLMFTLPLLLIFIFNTLFFDLPDTDRLPYTWWRFAVTLGGSCLLLAGMIWVGIWFPARKIAKMNPADALHYE